MKTILRHRAFYGVLLLGAVYYAAPLWQGQTFYLRDLTLQFLPQYHLLADNLAAKQLPLWNPYLNGGQPLLASPTYAPLYPLNLLFFFLPFVYAFNLLIVLHYLGCAGFAYVCARSLGLRPASSCLVAVIYGWCGFTLSLGNSLTILRGMPYIPLLLTLWHRHLRTGTRRWFALSVGAGVVQVLAGAPETCVIAMLLLLGWTLGYPYSRLVWYKRCGLWCTLGAGIIGLAAIQVVPSSEMLHWSSRHVGISFSSFAKWSLYPARLPEMVLANFWMDHAEAAPTSYWGWAHTAEKFPLVLSIYVGAVSLFLALWGGLGRDDDPSREFCHGTHDLPKRVRTILLAMLLGAVFFSLGRFWPFDSFRLLYYYVPFLTIFRYPVKFLAGGILPLALLAGYSCERYFEAPAVRSRPLLAAFWAFGGMLILCTAAFWLVDAVAVQVQAVAFQQSGPHIRQHLQQTLLHTTLIWLLGAVLYQYRYLTRRAWQGCLLVCIVALDLCVAGKNINLYAPASLYREAPPAVALVSKIIGHGRLYKEGNPNENILLIAPDHSDNYAWSMGWKIEILEPYIPARYGFPSIFHHDTERMSQRYISNLTKILPHLTWPARLPFLAAAGVTAIITQAPLALPGVRLAAEIPTRAPLRFFLYKHELAMPRAAFVRQWKLVQSNREALRAMSDAGFDPRHQVVLQAPEAGWFDRTVAPPIMAPSAKPSRPDCAPAGVTVAASDRISTTYTVSTACSGLMVFAEPYYPGWRIAVDGQQRSQFRANYAFAAVYLEAGRHTVRRAYRPRSLVVGTLLTFLCGVLLTLFVCVSPYFRHTGAA